MTDNTHEQLRSRLLIVDDERLNLMALSAILRDEYELLVATNGKQALSLAAEQKPDLILLDVVMPDMDGHEVCRRLKADPVTHAIPVIFITAKNQVEDETRGFELGAVDYIGKPFNLAVVVARVRTHCRLKRQSDLLERMAMVDGLTGIPNRRAFDAACEREWARCRRSGLPFSLLMMDVDMFKQYNDNYGHGAGDNCLIKVGLALHETARRPGDFVGRYGGEEFVAVLAEADEAAAMAQANRFLEAVAALRLPHAFSKAGPMISISIGVATTLPMTDGGAAALKDAADKMLYTSKESGRNRATGTRIAV